MKSHKLGKYQLHEKLGEGATAEVYRAVDTSLEREVALKLLKPTLVSDPSTFERFRQEARAAAVLFHPNIATVFEIGEEDGRYFIAMRYIAGRSLNQVLEEDGPLPWDEVLRMADQLGEALDYAHDEGFLHRDVKPSNIIQSKNGDYVLTDFGLVRAMMNTGITTHTGALLGTPAYIAPEIWNGEEASLKSDQYAFACVLYESVTGEILFGGSTPQEIITKHLIKEPEFTEYWPKGIPAEIEIALTSALSREPKERYESIKVLVTNLAGFETQPKERASLEAEEKAKQEAEEATRRYAERVEQREAEQKANIILAVKYISVTLSILALIISRIGWAVLQNHDLYAGISCTVAGISIIFGIISINKKAKSGFIGIAISAIAILDALSLCCI